MYDNAWRPGGGSAATRYTPAAEFLKKVKAYRYDRDDVRPRCFPELGAVGLPFDRDGSARADWLQDIHNEVSTWNTDTVGFPFLGYIWWNAEGTKGDRIDGIGRQRYFQLDRRHVWKSDTDESPWEFLDPALPLEKFNELAKTV
jgi:hypothetical protein